MSSIALSCPSFPMHLCAPSPPPPYHVYSAPPDPPPPPLLLLPPRPMSRRHRRRRHCPTVHHCLDSRLSLLRRACCRVLFHGTVDLSDSPDLDASHTQAGQYLQLKVPYSKKPSFLAIATPPSLAARKGVFEFLVKSDVGSTAEILCGLKRGDVVELGPIMGNDFDVDRIQLSEEFPTVLIFATGSGIWFLC